MLWFKKKPPTLVSAYQHAQHWIGSNTISGKGIAITSKQKVPYPEVTGYYIPTLLESGERERAISFAKWLVSIQQPDGSWLAPNNIPYTFDIGQILKGLLAVSDFFPEAIESLIKGCRCVMNQIRDDGRVTTLDTSMWSLPNGKIVPEAIHLYALQPIKQAGKKYNIPEFEIAVEKAIKYYTSKKDLTDFTTLSHFHAYILEALIDLGEVEIAKKAIYDVKTIQKKDGAIPAYRDVNWVCSTGMAQYAVIFYKIGDIEPADRIMNYLIRLQNKSGGFYGSYGKGANYFPKEEISWAVKYYLDAFHWKIKSSFNRDVKSFPDKIDNNDGRLKVIIEKIQDCKANVILDLGCGKGRFASNVLDRYLGSQIYCLDISEKMIEHLPKGVFPVVGSMLNIPFPDEYFDLIYTVEALEHAVNIDGALKEINRVLKHGGTLVIVDKNKEKLGKLNIELGEKWFSKNELKAFLLIFCQNVEVFENIPYDEKDGKDGLFLAWIGTKKYKYI